MCTHKIKHTLHYEISKTDLNSAKVLSLSFHSAAVINMFVFAELRSIKSCICKFWNQTQTIWPQITRPSSKSMKSKTDARLSAVHITNRHTQNISRSPPPTHTEPASALTPTSSPHDLWLATWQLVHRFSFLFFFFHPQNNCTSRLSAGLFTFHLSSGVKRLATGVPACFPHLMYQMNA